MKAPSKILRTATLCLGFFCLGAGAMAQESTLASSTPPAYDPQLAQQWGADDLGMRSYVFVLLKTGPQKMAAGPERDAMFKGHFANLRRLSEEGKLVVAGPFDGVDGWRGQMVLAVKDLAEAKACVETDPVIRLGEMVAEYHRFYGSAALMGLPAVHARIAKKQPGS